MTEVVWLTRATHSLDAILAHIAEDNPAAAKRLAVAILEQVELLATQPHMGRAGRVLGTRELVVHENYILPYRLHQKRIEILAVQHAKQRWPSRL